MNWRELSDAELQARLEQRGYTSKDVAWVVARRETWYVQQELDEVLG